jgi:RNA polymerase sigma factor (sigma-70 family)
MVRRDRFDGRFDAVLASARRGDARAFEEIFTTLAPIVAGYLRLQGSTEPDDLTSDVFLGVLRNLDSFQGGEAAFRSWLFTIAHRRLLDERRRLRRRPPPEPLADVGYYVAPDDVEATVVSAVGQDRVRILCDALAPDQRDVMLLRLLGGLTVEEVATTLGKSPGAVKALQRRGYASIARRLEREGVPL